MREHGFRFVLWGLLAGLCAPAAGHAQSPGALAISSATLTAAPTIIVAANKAVTATLTAQAVNEP